MKNELALEFYQELYRLELDKKEKITQQAQLRFAVLLTVSSILLYMLKTMEVNLNIYVLVFFSLSLFMSFVGMLSATYCVYRVFWGNEYTYLANAMQYEDQRQALIEAYGESMPDKVDVLWRSLIIESVVAASESNHKVNLKRQTLMASFTKRFNIALVAFVLSGVIFIGLDLDSSSPRKAISVEVISKA